MWEGGGGGWSSEDLQTLEFNIKSIYTGFIKMYTLVQASCSHSCQIQKF